MQDHSHRNWVPQLSQHPTKRPKVVTFAYTSMLEARESWAFFYIYFQKKILSLQFYITDRRGQ